MMNDQLKMKLATIGHRPGVYQYYDGQGKLLYVGKAKDLIKRVQSYFSNRNHTLWTKLLIAEIADVQVTEVSTELEAIMLENSLIKSLRPKYNLQLKDDKTFPFLRVSNESFPEFSVIRKVKHDKARYFGPYFSAVSLRSLLQLLKVLYGVKTTSSQSYESRSSVPKEIGLGERNLDDRQQYAEQVNLAIAFLATTHPKMEKILKDSMAEAAKNEQFEKATILRDRWQTLLQLRQNQSLFSPKSVARDYVGIATTGHFVAVYILFEREGKIVNNQTFVFTSPVGLTSAELTQFALEFIYINGLPAPQEIVLESEPENGNGFQQVLSQQFGHKVKFTIPQKGEVYKKLLAAIDNAQHKLKLEGLRKSRREDGMANLTEILHLPYPPKRIEAFDISNLGSTNIVGASIVFIDGQPAKNEYRKYIIVTPEGQNDFASMRELVYRRLSNKQRPLPDLLLIDGGKGQLSAALDAMSAAKVNVSIVALAKQEELLFIPGSTEPVRLPHDSNALLLLMAVRDEVHRYVIGFHRQRRSKKFIHNA